MSREPIDALDWQENKEPTELVQNRITGKRSRAGYRQRKADKRLLDSLEPTDRFEIVTVEVVVVPQHTRRTYKQRIVLVDAIGIIDCIRGLIGDGDRALFVQSEWLCGVFGRKVGAARGFLDR